ncbi:hypothetical protein ACFVR1_03360 [Psychrobacillus sp. NPDC058041]|uniref:hypothetical protein n=1 Tax=Psychrobacillus sp. NPDC058041 TaxID=3346310 RepID=UPI0036DA50B8
MANINDFTQKEKQNALDEARIIMQMKVFKMKDYERVAYYSEEDAKVYYHNLTGSDMGDIVEEFEGEVPFSNTVY